MKNYNEIFENKNEFANQLHQQKSQENINENTKTFSKCETINSNKNYFRITGYCPEHDFCFIIDSNGMFEKLWQFSSYLISKGIKVIEVSKLENIIDINITPAEEYTQHLILRATAEGKPEYIKQTIDGVKYKTIKIADKIYIPDKEQNI